MSGTTSLNGTRAQQQTWSRRAGAEKANVEAVKLQEMQPFYCVY